MIPHRLAYPIHHEVKDMSETKTKPGWWPSLVVFEGITLALGALTGFLTRSSMGIYDSIQKPVFAPPPWLFPVAWSILYIAMALSAWLVWREKTPGRTASLILYWVQLAVNLAWPFLFFMLKAFGLSFVWLVVLWSLIIIMLTQFYRQSKPAFWLNIPYLCWVTFAGFLNFMIARLNP